MRLTFEFFDGRRVNFRDIIDQDTGEKVGDIRSNGVGFGALGPGGIDIAMFDGKYRKTVNSYDQCWGFVKGVETVLRHMTSTGQRATQAPTSAVA